MTFFLFPDFDCSNWLTICPSRVTGRLLGPSISSPGYRSPWSLKYSLRVLLGQRVFLFDLDFEALSTVLPLEVSVSPARAGNLPLLASSEERPCFSDSRSLLFKELWELEWPLPWPDDWEFWVICSLEGWWVWFWEGVASASFRTHRNTNPMTATQIRNLFNPRSPVKSWSELFLLCPIL